MIKKKLILFIFAIAVLFVIISAKNNTPDNWKSNLDLKNTPDGFKIAKFIIEQPEKIFVKYKSGPLKKYFPNGLPVGIGSGMCFYNITKDGAIEFIGLSDRGPNAVGPVIKIDTEKYSSKIFPVPGYGPQYGIISVKNNKAVLKKTTSIRTPEGKIVTGRPMPHNLIGATFEIGLNESLEIINPDTDGLDTEGIQFDRKNSNYIWICDEYGPFIVKVNFKNGKIINKYGPESGLPGIIKYRQPNRGFEGLAITPSNRIYAAVQSICDVDGEIKKSKAQFIRIVELDPETGKTKMFAYPHDINEYTRSRDAKIGELTAINNSEFLLIEQAKNKDGKMRNVIYKINIKNASDITGLKTPKDAPLETLTNMNELKSMGIKLIEKTKILDLKDYGWEPTKAEGLAIIDNETIAIASDNDFGIKLKVINPVNGENKSSKYLYENGIILLKNKEVNTSFAVIPNNEECWLWIINLKEKLNINQEQFN